MDEAPLIITAFLTFCEVILQVGEARSAALEMIVNGEHGSGETAKKVSQFLGASCTNMFIVSLVLHRVFSTKIKKLRLMTWPQP